MSAVDSSPMSMVEAVDRGLITGTRYRADATRYLSLDCTQSAAHASAAQDSAMGSSKAQVSVTQPSVSQTSRAHISPTAVSASESPAAQTALAQNSANNQSRRDVHILRQLREFDGGTDPTHPKVTSVAILKHVQPEVWTTGRYHTVSYQDYREAVWEEKKTKLMETKIDAEARPCILLLPVTGMTYPIPSLCRAGLAYITGAACDQSTPPLHRGGVLFGLLL